jgi:hypothetical protein
MVEWDKDREQAKVKSGYAALERESDAARERVWELMRRVATMVTQSPPASLLATLLRRGRHGSRALFETDRNDARDWRIWLALASSSPLT